MNKTDLVFYVSTLILAWKAVADQVHSLVSGNVFAWLNIVSLGLTVVAYAFYEKINGNPPVPPQP